MNNTTEPNTKIKNSTFSYPISNLHPQFEMDELESKFHNEIIKRQADENPFSFISRKDSEATIFKANHLRLSTEEAKRIKEFMQINILKGHKYFIIDLSNSEFIDSSFLGAIIFIAKKLKRKNGKITLVADPKKLKILHALQELNKILIITSTIDEAVESMNNYIAHDYSLL